MCMRSDSLEFRGNPSVGPTAPQGLWASLAQTTTLHIAPKGLIQYRLLRELYTIIIRSVLSLQE